MKPKAELILTTIALLLFQIISFGQAPALGTASDFALFTVAGAFTNYGDSTSVIGDVGTNDGIFTAFPPGNLTGQIQVANPASLQAATDVNNAYSSLSENTCETVIGVTLGNGQILTSGVYCQGAASTLNGDLTFDGQGNPDAIFIIKIGGAFATSVFSNVILIDSASYNNVYWQVNGQFDLGENSVFKGTLIANGAVNLLEGSRVKGRVLSIAGAISLQNTTVSILSDAEEKSLPVELSSFEAQSGEGFICFTWTTFTETNNDYFTVERSMDAVNFEAIAYIDGAGNSNMVQHYSIRDYDPIQLISYKRLKQTDFDGQYTYSKIIPVNHTIEGNTEIVWWPYGSIMNLSINTPYKGIVTIRIFDSLGKKVVTKSFSVNAPTTTTSLSTEGFKSGVYILQMTYGNHIKVVKIIIL